MLLAASDCNFLEKLKRLDSPALRAMPNSANHHAVAVHAIHHNVRSAPDNQLACFGLSADTTKVRMGLQRLNHCDNASREPFCGIRFIAGHVIANLSQASAGQRRPDNFYWQSASSSCGLPQTHFGGCDSFAVPHDSSQAFMSSCLT